MGKGQTLFSLTSTLAQWAIYCKRLCFSFLALSAKLPTGLYFLLASLGEQLSQDPLDRFSQCFYQMKAFWVQMIELDLFFFDTSRDVAMATDFVKKWQIPHIRRSGIQKRNGISLPQCAH